MSETRAVPDTRQRPGTAGDRVLAAALGLVRERGLSVGLDRISLEEAVAAAGVSRATAYRRWPSKDDFLRDVLLDVVRAARVEPEDDDDLAALHALAAAHRATLGTPAGWRTFVVECFRVTAETDLRRLAASREWRDHLALRATCSGLPAGELRDTVHAALAEAEHRSAVRRAEVYVRVPGLLGYRLVPWLDPATGFVRMAEAMGALMSGLVARAGVVDARPPTRMRAFGSTLDADWSVEGYALVALLLSYLEPDPDVRWDDAHATAALARVSELEDEVRRLRTEA